MIEPYGIALMQTATRVVENAQHRDEVIEENLKRCLQLIDFAAGEKRFGTKLLLFPEFFLTGVPESRRHEEYIMRSIKIPGPVIDRFSEKAKKYEIYISGHSFEIDDDWPGRCFSTSYIIGPDGNVILKYRKHHDIPVCLNVHPGDVYSEYVKRYGEDSLFPVVDTPIGRLACIICYDINWPEVTRCLAFNGAEVILMSTGDGYAFSQQHQLMRRARAYENSLYLASATHGKFVNSTRPEHQQRGYSDLIDFSGNVAACIDGPGECVVTGTIDIENLRRHRSRANLWNFMAGFRPGLYVKSYQKAQEFGIPNDVFAKTIVKNNEEYVRLNKGVLQRLYEKNIFKKPFTG